jgi:hypothetical protein
MRIVCVCVCVYIYIYISTHTHNPHIGRIYIYEYIYIYIFRPPLWSSNQSSWLQIQRSGLDSRHYQIFRKVVGLERGPLSLLSTIEELLERKSRGSRLEIRAYGRRDPSRWSLGNFYPQKLTLTSPTSCGRLVGIVRSRTQDTEISFLVLYILIYFQ